TRLALRAFWAPVGSGVMPKEDTAHLIRFLLGGPEGEKTVDRIDGRIHQMPGLDGLHLVRRAAAKYRAATSPAT
ncbi:MAG: hypothetical protein ACRDUA_05285, partial [Micromonosporaceae bacterium]